MNTDNRTNEPRRLKSCVEAWPECETGEYNPSCCRFPKSCSATVYSEEHVTEDDLEPPAALVAAGVAPQEPNQTETKSGNNFVSLDPEKVAALIESERDRAAAERDFAQESLGQFMAPALCEAAKRGELS